MALDFYWASGSCNSWRVHLALELKKVPYEAHLLTISKREHKSPEFLAINPRGKVPAIRDGAFTLSESVAILLYLDRKYPDPPLFGRTPEESGRILRQVLDLVYHVEPKLDRVAVPIYQQLGQFPGVPEGKVDTQADAIKVAAAELHQELATLDSSLTRAPFLLGDSPSAADCTALAFIEHTLRAAGKDSARPLDLGFLPLEKRHPALAAWLDRMRALPEYQKAYPPHWR